MNQKEKKKLNKQKPTITNKKADKFENNSNKWVWYALAVVFLTTYAIYSKAIKFDFLLTWDDYLYITENSHVKDLHWANIKLLFTNYYANNYHPLTMLFYAVEYKMGAGHASLFHFNNILFHLLNTYLVFVLIKIISPKNAIVALITTVFFAIHPMHVESVAWVSERKDVLYTFFFLLSLITYTNYLKKQEYKQLIYTCIFFVLSCLSKSAAVILPLVLILLDYYSNPKYSWKMIVEKLPFFAISLVFGLIATYSQKGAIQDMAPNMSVVEHISVVSFSIVSYLFKALIPVSLSAIYPYPIELGNTLPVIYYLSVLCVGLLLFFVWYSSRFGKDIIFGFLFFIITIILVLQFVPVGAASMADRYTYIPYIGVFFIVGKLFEYFSNNINAKFKKYSKYLLVVFIIGFISFSLTSYSRVKKWENGDALFSDVVNKYPKSSISYRIRGDYYLSYYTKNIGINENAKRVMYINKAILDFENATKFPLNSYNKTCVYYGLGTAYCNRGYEKYVLKDYNGALEDYSKVIELNQNDVNAYFTRGSIKNEIKDYSGAIKDFDKAIIINSNYFNAYNNRGNAKFNIKDYNGALEDFNKAILLNPQFSDAINNRDMILSILKNSENK